MGAVPFVNVARGKTPQEAFNNAVSQAQHDHGHSGYSGSIAEKDSFVMIDHEEIDVKDWYSIGEEFIDTFENEVDDKWGPAGCVKIKDIDAYVFFGWASS